MSFPLEMLAEGEEIAVEIRPHWTYLGSPAAVFLPSLGMMLAAALLTPDGWPSGLRGAIVGIAVAQFVLATAASGLRILKWLRTRLLFTNLRVVSWEGSLRMRGVELKLRRIKNLGVGETTWGRLLGVGDLFIHSTLGDHCRRFAFMPRPRRRLGEVLLHLSSLNIALDGEADAQTGLVPQASSSRGELGEAFRQLQVMRSAKRISESEYRRKMRELRTRC